MALFTLPPGIFNSMAKETRKNYQAAGYLAETTALIRCTLPKPRKTFVFPIDTMTAEELRMLIRIERNKVQILAMENARCINELQTMRQGMDLFHELVLDLLTDKVTKFDPKKGDRFTVSVEALNEILAERFASLKGGGYE